MFGEAEQREFYREQGMSPAAAELFQLIHLAKTTRGQQLGRVFQQELRRHAAQIIAGTDPLPN